MQGILLGNRCSRVPIIQGGMGVGVSLSNLAGAVARSGGIGIISTADIGFREPDFDVNPVDANLRAIAKEFRAAQALAEGGLVGANVMVATREYEDTVRACVEAGANLIISGAGLPLNLPELVQGSKTKIAPIVSSARAFQLILKTWVKRYQYIPDLVVVEGPEAGGHLGFHYEDLVSRSQTLDLVLSDVLLAVREAESRFGVHIPVIAAGGIFSGQEAAHYLAVGADGVQVATRFVATEECDAAPAFKQAYVSAKEEDLQIIKSPVGLPGRAIRNPFLCRIEKGAQEISSCCGCLKSCHRETAPFCITQALIQAVQGDVDNGLIFCGSDVSRIDRISTVKEVMEDLCSMLDA